MSIQSQRHRWMITGLFIAVISGCGEKATTYWAEGKVTFPDGRPLAGAIVSFRSLESDRPITARGRTDSNGNFTLTTFTPEDGAILGKHQALVAIPVVEADGPFAKSPVDLRFADFWTSGLEFVVTDDVKKNRFEIVVTPPDA